MLWLSLHTCHSVAFGCGITVASLLWTNGCHTVCDQVFLAGSHNRVVQAQQHNPFTYVRHNTQGLQGTGALGQWWPLTILDSPALGMRASNVLCFLPGSHFFIPGGEGHRSTYVNVTLNPITVRVHDLFQDNLGLQAKSKRYWAPASVFPNNLW